MDSLNPVYWFYQTLGLLCALPVILLCSFKGRHGRYWSDRLGFSLAGGGNPLWLHGASVGEVKSALAIITAALTIKPNLRFVLSVGTPSGLKLAKSLTINLKDSLQIMAQPLDFLGSAGRSFDRVNPRALILVETEIWPGLIRSALARQIPVLLVSGRLSARSVGRYSLARKFFHSLFSNFSLAAVISKDDQNRFISLGCPVEKTMVLGNPKFDPLIDIAQTHKAEYPNRIPQQILAASTHKGEEEQILKIIKSLQTKPNLILAPRHPQRALEVLELSKNMGFSSSLFSQNQPTPVVVVDGLGYLYDLYPQCNIAIIGGSFLKGAGHNPLEPAAFGRPVIFGPCMSSFKEPAQALVAEGGAVMATIEDLYPLLTDWLENPDKQKNFGLAGKNYLANLEKVAPRLANIILEKATDKHE